MTKLCPRGKAAAKRKFDVYPSAYANAYASKICAGKIKDPSGVKRKDFRGPKPSGAKVSSFIIQKFSCCFSLSFNVSIDVLPMFFSSMIMIFPCLLKS